MRRALREMDQQIAINYVETLYPARSDAGSILWKVAR
jgi:hypothetical protein